MEGYLYCVVSVLGMNVELDGIVVLWGDIYLY